MLLDYFEMFFSVYKSIVIIVFWGHEGKSKFILYINENITKLRFGFRRNSLYKTWILETFQLNLFSLVSVKIFFCIHVWCIKRPCRTEKLNHISVALKINSSNINQEFIRRIMVRVRLYSLSDFHRFCLTMWTTVESVSFARKTGNIVSNYLLDQFVWSSSKHERTENGREKTMERSDPVLRLQKWFYFSLGFSNHVEGNGQPSVSKQPVINTHQSRQGDSKFHCLISAIIRHYTLR